MGDTPASYTFDEVLVESTLVWCDGKGKGDDLGHPQVYLNMGKEGSIVCPYCSRKFVLVERSG